MPHIEGDNKKGHWQPLLPDQYKGKQLIKKSQGRILIDSGDDSLFYANNGFLFSTNGEIHFNTSQNKSSMFMVDSPRIQLGIDSPSSTVDNAAVKSNELISKSKAKLLGFASIIDRSTKLSLKIKTEITSHLKIEVPTYKANKLPPELKSIPITTPGSRFIK